NPGRPGENISGLPVCAAPQPFGLPTQHLHLDGCCYDRLNSPTLPASKPLISLAGNGADIDSLVIEANGTTVVNLDVLRSAADQGAGIELRAQDVTLGYVDVENLAAATAADSQTLGYGILVPPGANASGLTAEY